MTRLWSDEKGKIMTQYVCDRCHETSKTSHFNLVVPAHPTPWNAVPEKSYDLCESCTRQLDDFLEPLPKVAAKEGQ